MKRILALTIVFIMAASLGFAGGAGQAGSAGTLDIGLAMPETHVERWQRDGADLLAGAQARGYSAEVTFGDADQGQQNRQIQDFITKGVRLLIVGNINEGVNSVITEAAEEDIIVIAYDRLITGSDAYDYYITFDNFKVGQMQGEAIRDALGLASATTPKNIALFAGSPTDNNANFFFDGAMDILRPFVQSGVLNIVGPAPLQSSDRAFTQIATENWRAELAKARMENLLNNEAANVVLDAVLAPNDTLARAIIEALSDDAKYSTVDTLPVVTGQDGELASVKAIIEGRQEMTVFKDTRSLAEAAIELADALLNNRTPNIPNARRDTTTYDTGRKIVTSFLLEPINVNQSNVREVMIGGGYYTEADLQ